MYPLLIIHLVLVGCTIPCNGSNRASSNMFCFCCLQISVMCVSNGNIFAFFLPHSDAFGKFRAYYIHSYTFVKFVWPIFLITPINPLCFIRFIFLWDHNTHLRLLRRNSEEKLIQLGYVQQPRTVLGQATRSSNVDSLNLVVSQNQRVHTANWIQSHFKCVSKQFG